MFSVKITIKNACFSSLVLSRVGRPVLKTGFEPVFLKKPVLKKPVLTKPVLKKPV